MLVEEKATATAQGQQAAPVIRLRGLSKAFKGHLGIGRTVAVESLDLEVRQGEIFVLTFAARVIDIRDANPGLQVHPYIVVSRAPGKDPAPEARASPAE